MPNFNFETARAKASKIVDEAIKHIKTFFEGIIGKGKQFAEQALETA